MSISTTQTRDSEAVESIELMDSSPKRSFIDRLREHPEWLLVPGLFVVVVTAWELIVNIAEVPDYLVPAPSQIVDELRVLLISPLYWDNALVTLQEAASGYGIGVAAGVTLGFIITQARLIERMIFPYVVAFQTVPKLALAPLFVIWFGFGLSSKIAIAALSVFFPMLMNVIEGLKSTDPDRAEMLRATGANRWQTFRMLKFPNALPFVFVGLKLGVIFAMLGAIVGEFVGAKEGLGYLLLQYNYQFRISGMFAVMITLSAIGLTGSLLITAIQRRVVFWVGPGHVVGSA